MRVKDLCAFIKEREKARLGKGKDPIIAKYRFCNVRRNDDRVTKDVFAWAAQYGEDHRWFAYTIARLFNNKETLEEIAPFVWPFKPERMRQVLHFRRDRGAKNFNAAYIVSTNGRRMDKVEYLIKEVLGPLWIKRNEITHFIKNSTGLDGVHKVLQAQNGLGSFMAAQIVADLKYDDQYKWIDFDTFAASGPGSKRGMNRLQDLPVETGLAEQPFRLLLVTLRERVNKMLKWEEPLTAQDLQNCLCEFDKYERARTGEGEPKQLYRPHQGV